MGRMIEFARPDGKRAPGYLAEPVKRDGAPRIVMLQEWWGLNDEIKQTAEEFAREGFRVLIPDLYRGRSTAEGEEANHLAAGLDFGDAATQDARGAAQFLQKQGGKVGVIGYCMGGALALIAALHDPEFAAVVTYYGYPGPEAGDLSKIRIPVMGHWAKHDAHFNLAGVEAIEAKLKAGSVPHEFFTYDAKHAFANPKGLGNYDHEIAQTAFRRTIEFFEQNLAP
ncbi:MAG TPA: dienelactone hydrolase family protein [Candidatus Tyrphobacter sp.]